MRTPYSISLVLGLVVGGVGSAALCAPAVAKSPAQTAPDVPTGEAAARDAVLAQKVTPLVSAFSNSAPVLTRDGQQVCFISTRDGLPQLYVADAARPDAPATRLTRTTERVANPLPLRDGRTVLYQSDHGADENWSIFQVPLAGGAPVELTPGSTLQRDPPDVAEADPGIMYYAARRTEEARSVLYAQAIAAGAAPRELYVDPGYGTLDALSRDGKYALWLQVPTLSENRLLLLDLRTHKARLLYPEAKKSVKIRGSGFSPDGKRVYVSTDGGTEQTLLLALDPATGKELARYVETHPTINVPKGLAIAKQGGRIALHLGAGEHDEVRILDAQTLAAQSAVKLPLGSGSVGSFAEDGSRFTVDWSSPQAPTDLYTVDARSGAVAALRRESRTALMNLPPLDVSIVQIPAFDGGKIPANLYLPGGAAQSGTKRPVIVSFHGGPASASQIRWSAMTRFFTGLGYAWVEPNVRGSDGFGRAYEQADNGPRRGDAFKDIEAAGRWAASQPWADGKRLIIMGGSYGGYSVLIGLTRMPTLWQAGVDMFGVVNLPTFLASTSGVIRDLFKLEFGDVEKDAALLESQSPIRDVAKIVAPLFVYAGANDPRVPRAEDDQIVQALRQRGIGVEYMVADNEGHSLSHRENQIALMARVARFLESHSLAPVAEASRSRTH